MPEPKPVDIKVFVPPDVKKNYQRLCLEEEVKMSSDLRDYITARIDGTIESIRSIKAMEPSKVIKFMETLASWLDRGNRPTNAEIVKAARKLRIETEILMQFCDRLFPAKEKCTNGIH